MPICPKCRLGYEDDVEFCPKCSTRKPMQVPPQHVIDKLGPKPDSGYVCGKLGFLCLQALQFITYVSSIASVIFAVVMIYRGYYWNGFVSLCLCAPAAYGLSIAFALAIHYAENNHLIRTK